MSRSRWTAANIAVGLVLLAGVAAGQASPEASLHRLQRGQPLDPCPQPRQEKGYVTRESRGDGFTVDSCGRKVSDLGELLPSSGTAGKTVTVPATIDRMTTQFSWSRAAGDPIPVIGSANVYSLSDGSSWTSGAGSSFLHPASLDHVEVSGTTIRYVLKPDSSGWIYQQTDYDSGDHSAQGTLGSSGALVIEAQAGSTTAVLHGQALLVSNDATAYGDRFNYYTAIVGSVLPLEVVYTLQGGSTWTADAFSRPFSFTLAGSVDFAHPISAPRPVDLTITGPAQIPDASTIRYITRVTYENGIQQDRSAVASWTVDPPELASIAAGVLTTGTLTTASANLTLHATFVQGADTLVAQKQVLCLAVVTAEKPGTWPMYQANARHTGYVATFAEPANFRLKWQKTVGSGSLAVNPVAAGDGKVFATLSPYFDSGPSLFALRASDGATLWSAGFGSVYSVNPPSYAYGNVYLQTCDNYADTWLHSFDGKTGEEIFKAPHAAQWERYLAPAIYDGKVYIDGGTYGGMYGFDAYSGSQLWFANNLPQVDGWTPAVDAGRAYTYVGGNAPGLFAEDRTTGMPAFVVADPNFSWNDIGHAAVLGDHNDILVVNGGRLLSFDTTSQAIRWSVQSQFTGQPSLANDRIYVIDAGKLRVLDEVTHAEIWSWQPVGASLVAPLIVTDRHVFVSAAQSVYAVDLASRQPVWSYPVGGQLALADNTLYVASQNGTLTAFAGPPAMSFYTVQPCRLVDTRSVSDGPALSGGIARALHMTGRCGVPDTAAALSVNVTVTQTGAPGYLRLDAAGSPASVFSTLNYALGQTRTDNAILALSSTGDVTASATQSAGSTVHVVIDVNGYFQ